MNAILQEIFASQIIPTPHGKPIRLRDGISPAEAELISATIEELQAARTLEIGLALGLSALAICGAIATRPGARHIILDPSQNSPTNWDGIGLYNLERAGFKSLIEFYEQPSAVALPALQAAGTRLDFAFVDGRHTFDHVLIDFFYIDQMLRVGGVIMFDDADWPSIRSVIRFMVANRAYTVYKTLPAHIDDRRLKRKVYEAAIAGLGRGLNLISRLPGLRLPISRMFSAETLGIDRKFGLRSSCIALRKNAEDRRETKWHVTF